MARIDGSPRRRRGGLWALAAIVMILVGITWLTAPSRIARGDSGAEPLIPGVIETGPKPSSGLSRPGSMTQGLPGSDSRDNGTANAGRAAPASDPTPAPVPTPTGPLNAVSPAA